jgi:hypothetical protein
MAASELGDAAAAAVALSALLGGARVRLATPVTLDAARALAESITEGLGGEWAVESIEINGPQTLPHVVSIKVTPAAGRTEGGPH